MFRPLLLLSVMTFVGRRIRVEGLVYPRGEGVERGRQTEGEREREWDGRRGRGKDMQTDRSVDYGNMN